jgi:hypothetical protein
MEIPFYCIVNDQAVKDSAESAGVHQPEGSAGGRSLRVLRVCPLALTGIVSTRRTVHECPCESFLLVCGQGIFKHEISNLNQDTGELGTEL